MDDGFDWFDGDYFDGGKVPRIKFVYRQNIIDCLFSPTKPADANDSAQAWKLAAEAIRKAKAP